MLFFFNFGIWNEKLNNSKDNFLNNMQSNCYPTKKKKCTNWAITNVRHI